MKKLIALASIAALFASCNSSPKQDQTQDQAQPTVVKIDGSSTVYPISEAVAEDFNKDNPDVKVTIGISGTGGGMKKFSAGEIDIADASRPIKPSEVDACSAKGIKFIELPIAYDGLCVVVNPKNTWVDHLTTSELKMMWDSSAQGKIMTWDQVRKGWPKKSIKLFGPGTDSGTFDYFTEVINGKAKRSRGDYTPSEDDNVLVQGVSSDEGALGYFGLAYYEENKDKLKLIPIDDGKDDNGKGAITPSLETVQNGTYAPLSRVLFIYVNSADNAKKEVQDFVTYYLKNAASLSKEVGYIPLQDNLYPLVSQRYTTGVLGSIYQQGEEGGTTLEGLMQSQAAAQH